MMKMNLLFLVANVLGFLTISKALISFSTWVWVTFLRSPKDLKSYGSWALVTGSTDGIGKAFAFALASKGLNVILVGRSISKLKATTTDIHERYGCQVLVKSLVIDFCNDPLDLIHEKIKQGIDGLDVGVLVNNVGMSYPWPRYFHEVDSSTLDEVIKVNVKGTTWVTRAVLPLMLKKKKGAIINVGSGSSVIIPSFPLYTVYSATKVIDDLELVTNLDIHDWFMWLLQLWDLTARKLLHDFKCHEGQVQCIDFHPHEFLLATDRPYQPPHLLE